MLPQAGETPIAGYRVCPVIEKLHFDRRPQVAGIMILQPAACVF
jgi:hypothetical protein